MMKWIEFFCCSMNDLKETKGKRTQKCSHSHVDGLSQTIENTLSILLQKTVRVRMHVCLARGMVKACGCCWKDKLCTIIGGKNIHVINPSMKRGTMLPWILYNSPWEFR